MKRILTISVLGLCFMFTQFANSEGTGKKMDLKTDQQKLGYVLGFEFGTSLNEIQNEIELEAFIQGLRDNLSKSQTLMTPEETAKIKDAFMKRRQEEQMTKFKELSEKNKTLETEFLAKNKTDKDVKSTASGLQYKVITEGSGASPKPEDKVTVNYAGALLDGTEFDSSYKRGQPAQFQVGQVIPGWSEALGLMKVGGKYKLFIPSRLAYGERGAGMKIPPNAMLIFDVELLGIGDQKPAAPATPANLANLDKK